MDAAWAASGATKLEITSNAIILANGLFDGCRLKYDSPHALDSIALRQKALRRNAPCSCWFRDETSEALMPEIPTHILQKRAVLEIIADFPNRYGPARRAALVKLANGKINIRL